MKKTLMTLSLLAASAGAVYALGGALTFAHAPVPAPAALKPAALAPKSAADAPKPAAEEPAEEDVEGCG